MNHTENINNSIPQFSFFLKPIFNKKPYKKVTVNEVYNLITGDYFKKATIQLRNFSDKKEAEDFKRTNFHYACFSGIFEERYNDKLIKHSGLICVDFDHLAEKENWEKLLADPNISTALLFVSPSGDGLKWIVLVDIEKATHLDYYDAIHTYILKTYGATSDSQCKNVSRPCFLPYDPECFFNPSPDMSKIDVKYWLQVKYELEKDKRKKQECENIPSQIKKPVPPNTTRKQKTFEEIVTEIESRGIDMTGNYKDWLKIGFAIADKFGVAGRDYFKRISCFHPEYDEKETDLVYSNLLKSKGSGIRFKSFFYCAKQAGIQC